MAVCSLGSYSKNYLFFIFGSLTLIARTYVGNILDPKFDQNKTNTSDNDTIFNNNSTDSDSDTEVDNDIRPYSFFKTFFMGVGMSLCFIIELIIRSSFKSNVYKNEYQKKDKLKILSKEMFLILLISFLDMLGFVTAFWAISNETLLVIQNLRYVTQFLVALLLTIFILKVHLFKHHVFFSIFIFVGTIIVVVSYLISGPKFQPNIFIVFIDGILYGIVMVIAKWIMDYKFISPFIIVSIMGCFSIITTFIGIAAFKLITKFTLLTDKIWACVGFIITSMFYNIAIMMIVKHFGSTNRVIMDLLCLFILGIIELLTSKEEVLEHLFVIIGNVISILGAVGFNEIIIFHCWNLNKDTKGEVYKRSLISNEIMDLQSQQEETLYNQKEKDIEDYDV